jgi:hypothetical protein
MSWIEVKVKDIKIFRRDGIILMVAGLGIFAFAAFLLGDSLRTYVSILGCIVGGCGTGLYGAYLALIDYEAYREVA